MSDASAKVEPRFAPLEAEERVWLDERLVEYAELLAYLHDH